MPWVVLGPAGTGRESRGWSRAPAGTATPRKRWHFRQALPSACQRSVEMAGLELRAALEQRLSALAIRTEVVEHPEVRLQPPLWPRVGLLQQLRPATGGHKASVSWVEPGT